MESSTPFVLSLLQAQKAKAVSVDDARAILAETIVLLVRRKMTEFTTTAYDVMFPQLLSKVINEPNKIHALHEQFRKYGVWISDQEFASSIETKSAYRSRDLPFARLLLIELDKTFQTFGQFPDYSTVPTIEHVLPQELTSEWRTYLGSDAEDEHLPQLIHTIGNLCLLSQPANSSAGQNPFTAKTDCYSEVTALARQIKNHQEPWNLAAIRSRSKLLAKSAVARWSWSS